ncbi:MAG: DUF1587 domain-containing protein, partial [Planctomycetia bacterium]|nr:DUF1587 domain-containing protein [Planctomycetia bacterium]
MGRSPASVTTVGPAPDLVLAIVNSIRSHTAVRLENLTYIWRSQSLYSMSGEIVSEHQIYNYEKPMRGFGKVMKVNFELPDGVARYNISLIVGLCLVASPCLAAEPESFDILQAQYATDQKPLIKRYCLTCHSTEQSEGELDLERFASIADVRKAPRVWLKVAEFLDNGEMPPKKAKQPSAEERKSLRGWVDRYLNAEAHASAGDPGPVALRRLSNAEYTYTIRDLTGVPLDPAREFPADGAAGEGFINAGNALGMSPALVTKYLDAGKDIARHLVLLPDGLRFSPGVTRRDFTDECIANIKGFYAQYANAEEKIPLEKYLAATLEERDALAAGSKTAAKVASERGLNAKYLAALWGILASTGPSPLLEPIRARWRGTKPADAPALAADIARWQQALSKYQNVGHIKPWVVPVNPLTARHEFRFKIPEPTAGSGEVTLFLAAGNAGDGSDHDFIVWQQPRLVTPGRPDLLLRDVRGFTRELVARRERVFASAANCLSAAAEAGAAKETLDVAALARRHKVDEPTLAAWIDFLGIGPTATIKLDLFTQRIEKSAGYDFVKGWGSGETPNLAANSSGTHVRIPGNMKPHGVVVHPSPTLQAAIGWRSPIEGAVRVSAKVTHAHPECGNGVAWSVELRRGATRQKLATGVAQGAKPVDVGPVEHIAVQT